MSAPTGKLLLLPLHLLPPLLVLLLPLLLVPLLFWHSPLPPPSPSFVTLPRRGLLPSPSCFPPAALPSFSLHTLLILLSLQKKNIYKVPNSKSNLLSSLFSLLSSLLFFL